MIPITYRGVLSRPAPLVTLTVSLACAVVFVVQQLQRPVALAAFCSDLEESVAARRAAAGSAQLFVCRWGAIPDELHKGQDLYTGLTSTLLHAGPLHLAVNLAYLLAFGPLVERMLGRAGTVAVLVGAAAASQAAHVSLDPDSTVPSVGISGALAAILALHLVISPGREVRVLVGPWPTRVPTWFVLGFWAVQQAILTLVDISRAQSAGGSASESHVAGLAVGLVVASALRRGGRARRAREIDPPEPASPGAREVATSESPPVGYGG